MTYVKYQHIGMNAIFFSPVFSVNARLDVPYVLVKPPTLPYLCRSVDLEQNPLGGPQAQ